MDCIRHELPIKGELANQNIKDRFYGVNDPVAGKMLREYDDNCSRSDNSNAASTGPSEPPEDKSIATLFVGGIDNRINESSLRYFMLSTLYQF